MRGRWLAVVLAALSGCCFDPKPSTPPPPQAIPPPKPSPMAEALAKMTLEDEAQRVALLEQSIANGWLKEMKWERHTLVVGAGFADLDFDVKQAAAWNVALLGMRRDKVDYYELRLVDPKTNKRVGWYSTSLGRLTLE